MSKHNSFDRIRLSEVVLQARSGFASGERSTSGVIQLRMNNVSVEGGLDLTSPTRIPANQKQLKEFSLEEGDVLFNNTNSPQLVGKTAYFAHVDEPVLFSNHFTRLRFDQKRVFPKYAARWLTQMQQSRYFEARCRQWVNQAAFGTESLLELEMPVPPLEEQKRIVTILDKADTIRRKRQQANGELEALEESAFAFTVGTRARGYEEWTEVTIESLAALHQGAMRTGPFGSSLLHSEFVDEGIAVLGIDNAVQNRFAWDQRRFITPAKYEEMKRYTVYPNDVIITIMGTVGRAAVIPEDIPTAITTKHIATLTLNTKIAEPEFVSQAMHRHPFIAMQMTNRGAIMNSWNLGLIKSLKVPLPPIDVQREFTKRVRQIRDLRNKLENGATEADHLFNSLVQRAFKGEL